MRVRKAVIPAGGLGTRLLPLSKSVPKELLPVFHKPLVQIAAEELAGAGIEETTLVVSPGKPALETFFQPNPQLEQTLTESASPLAEVIAAIPQLSHFTFVEQPQPLGLGHAVLMAAGSIGDEPFATLLPDDMVLHHRSATQQLLDVFHQYGGCVLAVEEVPEERISQYGVIDGTEVSQGIYQVSRLVEKPPPEEAPSNLAIVGRYILMPRIFEALRRTPPAPRAKYNSPMASPSCSKTNPSTPACCKAAAMTAAPPRPAQSQHRRRPPRPSLQRGTEGLPDLYPPVSCPLRPLYKTTSMLQCSSHPATLAQTKYPAGDRLYASNSQCSQPVATLR